MFVIEIYQFFLVKYLILLRLIIDNEKNTIGVNNNWIDSDGTMYPYTDVTC